MTDTSATAGDEEREFRWFNVEKIDSPDDLRGPNAKMRAKKFDYVIQNNAGHGLVWCTESQLKDLYHQLNERYQDTATEQPRGETDGE